jgi:hypothetical protein
MSHFNNFKFCYVSVCALLSLVLSGEICAQTDAIDRSSTSPIRRTAPQNIVAEIPNQVQRTYFKYLSDPEVSQRSWASIALRSSQGARVCSGVMIGPNTLLTAAHCGAEWVSGARFIAYVSPTEKIEEDYACRYLVFGWPETDANLVWCDAKDGVNPGDRWGYVDLDVDVDSKLRLNADASASRVAIGKQVYSNWWNPIDAIGGGDHMLFSSGQITNVTAGGWYNMGGHPCSQTDDRSEGVDTDVWGIGGASGSAHIASDTHRVLLGSNTSASTGGGNFRGTASVINLLSKASLTTDSTTGACATRFGPQVNRMALEALWDQGIKFDAVRGNSDKYYLGFLDQNQDGIFDVQHDLEKSAGEMRRDFYNLGFDSLRRAKLWQRRAAWWQINAGSFNVQPFWGTYSVNAFAGDWQQAVIFSPQLNMNFPQTHWLRFRVKSSGTAQVRVRVGGGEHVFNLQPGTDREFVRSVKGVSVGFDVRGSGILTFQDVTVWNHNRPFSFDMFDQRKVWKRSVPSSANPTQENAAIFVPHKRIGQTTPNWAGLVRATREPVLDPNAFRAIADDRLATHAFAAPPGWIRVCFDHRSLTESPVIGALDLQGAVKMLGLANSEMVFSSAGAWQRSCTASIRAWTTGIQGLEFRALVPPIGGTTEILIDNVSAEWIPSPVVSDPLPPVFQ